MADALIVGGGVMGLLTARELRRLGMDVTLLERDRPGRQASWASAGILANTTRGPLAPVDALLRASLDSFAALAAELREEAGLDIDYIQNGGLIPALDDDQAEQIARDTRELQAGGVACEFVTGAALRDAEPALGPAVVAARLIAAGNVENRRLVRALELANLRNGVRIESGTPVSGLLRNGRGVGGVRTLNGDYHAPLVVIAAGSWSGAVEGVDPPIPVVPQRGQILSLWPGQAGPRRVILSPEDPYLVPRAAGQLVIGATREFGGYDSSLTAGGLVGLLSAAITLVPALREAPVVEQWVGFRPLSKDGVPIIGPADLDGLYYITGHGPTGIGPAPASVKLLVSLIEGTEPPVSPAPYAPSRFRATAD